MKIEYLVYYKNKKSNKRVDSQSAYPVSKETYAHLMEYIQTHGAPCDVEVTTTTSFGGVPTQAKVLFKKEHIRRVETTIDFDAEQDDKSTIIDSTIETRENTLEDTIIGRSMESPKETTEVKTNIVDETIEEIKEVQVEANVSEIIEEPTVEEIQIKQEPTVAVETKEDSIISMEY